MWGLSFFAVSDFSFHFITSFCAPPLTPVLSPLTAIRPSAAGAFTSYMSSLARCPNHLPTLMAVAGLYKARGMLDEARSALQLALQTAEAAAAPSSTSSGSSSRSSNSSSQGPAVAPAAADAGAGAASGIASSADAADGSRPAGQLQLQTQASNDGSALSDMSTSSSIEGSSGSPAVSRPGSACGAQAAAGTGAGAVPLGTVKEALAVVLTDLGTRAKNAGAL